MVFVELACSERDIVVIVYSVRPSICPSKFVRPITSTVVDGFQNNLTQLFFIMFRCAIWNIPSGRLKVKVTLEGKIFVQTITLTILDGFQYRFAQLFSIMSRCAIWNICSGRPKVKGQGHMGWTFVPGQPSSVCFKFQTKEKFGEREQKCS